MMKCTIATYVPGNCVLYFRNALNIVKDDLIARVDQLTSEKDVCEERLRQTESQRDAARDRIEVLEQEIKKLKVKANRISFIIIE